VPRLVRVKVGDTDLLAKTVDELARVLACQSRPFP
jgi:hypothetical protein